MDCDTARPPCADLLKRPQRRPKTEFPHYCPQANGLFEFLCIIAFGATCQIKVRASPTLAKPALISRRSSCPHEPPPCPSCRPNPALPTILMESAGLQCWNQSKNTCWRKT